MADGRSRWSMSVGEIEAGKPEFNIVQFPCYSKRYGTMIPVPAVWLRDAEKAVHIVAFLKTSVIL